MKITCKNYIKRVKTTGTSGPINLHTLCVLTTAVATRLIARENMPRKKERDAWMKVLDLYKDLSCLHDKKHKDYFNRIKRQQAYIMLLQVYNEEFDMDITLIEFRKKLENMRTSFTRELKKVIASQRSSSNSDDWYQPTLWYYNHLSFLEEYIVNDRFGEFSTPDTKPQPYSVHKRRRSSLLEDQKIDNEAFEGEDDPLSDTEYYLEPVSTVKQEPSTSDTSARAAHDTRVMGEAIAVQMRGLDPLQSTIAHKLVSDVLFYARLGRLTEDSYVANVDPCRNNTL